MQGQCTRRTALERAARLASLCLTALPAAVVGSARAQANRTPPAAPTARKLAPLDLKADPRLARKVTIDVTGEPLAEMLARLGDDRPSLSCGRSCADMKVQVRLSDRPLSSLMEALADLLPGLWEKVGERGYRLEMTGEAEARRDRWWTLYLAERRRALADQSAAILDTLRAGPARAEAAPGPSASREPTDPAQEKAIRDEIRAQHGFFSSLPLDLQARIATNLDDGRYFCARDSRFMTTDDEGAISLRLRDLPAGVAEVVRKRAAAIRSKDADSLDFDHAIVCFSNGGSTIHANVYFPDGSTCGAAFSFSAPPTVELAAALPNHARLAALVKELGSLAPPVWKELAAYQESRVWPNDPPSDPIPQRSRFNRQADLDWLGRKAGIEYVADYYSHGGSPMLEPDRDRPVPGPVEKQLDLQAVQHDQSWKRSDDGVYLVRNNRWYRDDRMEAPAPLLRRWLAARGDGNPENRPLSQLVPADRIAALRRQLDWEAEVVTSLTRWQIENGLMLYMRDDNTEGQRKRFAASGHPIAAGPNAGEIANNTIVLMPFAEDSARIHSQYHTDVFYAGLTGPMRQALVEGRLPFAALTQAQQREALFLTPGLAAALEGPQGSRVQLGLAPRQGPGVFGAVGGTSVRLAVTGEG